MPQRPPDCAAAKDVATQSPKVCAKRQRIHRLAGATRVLRSSKLWCPRLPSACLNRGSSRCGPKRGQPKSTGELHPESLLDAGDRVYA